MDKEKLLVSYINESKRIVAFTGAGISTRSGIPDFRSAGGVYDQIKGQHYSGAEALSLSFFQARPKLFYQNYHESLAHADAEPNEGHYFFKALENQGKDVTVITQNIDGLHEAAGSSNVLRLHGTLAEWSQADSRQPVNQKDIIWDEEGIARDQEGNLLRPDIIMYEEMLDQNIWFQAEQAISLADLLIVVGSSLTVYPAAGLVDIFSGKYSVLINQSPVLNMDKYDLVVDEDAGEFLSQVLQEL